MSASVFVVASSGNLPKLPGESFQRLLQDLDHSLGRTLWTSPTTPRSAMAEDRGVLVLVDGDDRRRVLHPDQVLHGTGDAAGDVDRGLHRLARLSHLVAVRHPAGVDHGAGGTGGAAEQLPPAARSSRSGRDHRGRGLRQTTTLADSEVGPFARLGVPFGDGRLAGGADVGDGDVDDLGGGAPPRAPPGRPSGGR